MHERFHRTRHDHQSETAEDYAELLVQLEPEPGVGVRTNDLVAALGVSQPTVTKVLSRLQRDGWVVVEQRRRVLLTEAGRRLGESCLERHRSIVQFLVSIGVPPAQAELDAEGIEHHVSATTLEAMRRHGIACGAPEGK